ncbi:formimidoylglutamase [Paenarthrobacter sp. DKR-5]|uniref:formimidoylglutamase n=1 Tax=Paenarthrobacter sp. DKR-5 TaxID=2835535 RepID=UPI001BDCCAD6|nr:formimidoylglutamase [Paenarthrobacter sp. DKR-5]MBT1003381.1 formimidoylglutamase [Paenarthrobacter sp. DKR-5]
MKISAADAAPQPWTGRTDGDGAEHRRWHQAVLPLQPGTAPGAATLCTIVGFRSDEGVRRNHGRPGAAAAPAAIRTALGSLAFHSAGSASDAGDVVVEGRELEDAQRRLGDTIRSVLDAGGFPVVLGGGHETAFGSYLGAASSRVVRGGARLGVLNLDAHFDLREADAPSSGTPFLQMARAEAAEGRELNYAVLGISEPNNTAALFDTARRLSVDWLTDEDCGTGALDRVLGFVDGFLERIDVLYLTVDLDVLPAAVAPGVSAPAAYGVPLDVIAAVCRRVAASGKLLCCDVAELNPEYDVDSRTAKVAARLIHTVVHTRR